MKFLRPLSFLACFVTAGDGIALTVQSLHPQSAVAATSAVIQDASSESGAMASLARSTALHRSSAFYTPRICITPSVAGDDL